MAQWGKPVQLATEPLDEKELLQVGDKVKLYLEQTIGVLVVDDAEKVVEKTKYEYEQNPNFKLLYVHAKIVPLITGRFAIVHEIHLEVIRNPITVATAVAIALIVIAVVGAITWAYATFRFVEVTRGWGGIAIVFLLFILLFVFIGGKLGIKKTGVEVGG